VASARAIEMRWRWPPEKFVRIARASLRASRPGSAAARPAPRCPRLRMRSSSRIGSATMSATRQRGLRLA
jgi:hypothetical protein